MTEINAQVLETDVILFPPKLKREVLIKEIRSEITEKIKTKPEQIVKTKFARLKKSIRRRSSGIF